MHNISAHAQVRRWPHSLVKVDAAVLARVDVEEAKVQLGVVEHTAHELLEVGLEQHGLEKSR